MSQRKQTKFWFQPFSKRLVGVLGAKPLSRPTQRAKSPNDTKRSGRAAKTSRWDVLAKGNPIKGFPAGRSPAPPAYKQKPRQREETANASTRWRGFSLWMDQRCVMPQFFQNCGRGDIRGRPAGRLSLFWGCARGATGLDFAFCGKRGRGFAPSIPTSLLKKAGPKT